MSKTSALVAVCGVLCTVCGILIGQEITISRIENSPVWLECEP